MAVKQSLVGSAILGLGLAIFLIVWGAIHLRTPCAASPSLAAATLTLGALMVALSINSAVALCVGKSTGWAGIVVTTTLSLGYAGVAIWALVAAFHGDLWARIRDTDAATAASTICEPVFYKGIAITLIVLCSIALAALALLCACMACVGTVVFTDVLAMEKLSKDASTAKSSTPTAAEAARDAEEVPLKGGDVEQGSKKD